MPRRAFLALALIFPFLGGCRPEGPGPSVAPAPDPWVLTSGDTIGLLWNGQLGVRVDSTGLGRGPLLFIDRYDHTSEEKVISVYNPLTVDAGPTFSPKHGTHQTLDMRTGELVGRWKTREGAKVEVETVVPPGRPAIAQRWTYRVGPGQGVSIAATCTDVGLPEAATDLRNAEWPLGGARMRAVHATSDPKAEWQFLRSGIRVNATADPDGKLVFERVLVFDHQEPETFNTLEAETARTWRQRWTTDIEIDGPAEDQQAVRSFLFYLRSAIDPAADRSIAPFGLSNPIYNGHVFWDADVWVFPALCFIDPNAARAIPAYRARRFAQAQEDARIWVGQGRPTAHGRVEGPNLSDSEANPARFPWESSVTGRETMPGPSRWEDHVTGSIAWAYEQAAAVGLADAKVAAWMRKAAREFYLARAIQGPNGLEIRDVLSPDENRFVDNDLYTNLLAQWATGDRFKLPRDAQSLLAYDRDPVDTYKQPAAELAIYPLQNALAEREAASIMERIAPKVKKIGPALTDSLHALIWARIGDPDRAYELWRRSWRDFTRGGLLLFSEKRDGRETYFTTGAAACLQTVLYGFLGFRIDSKSQVGAAWSTPLSLGKILSLKPNLPRAWKSVKLRNFTILGKPYTLIVTPHRVRVVQGDR